MAVNLIGLLLVLLVACGIVVGLVALMANPRTRLAGILLSALVVLLLGAGMLVNSFTVQTTHGRVSNELAQEEPLGPGIRVYPTSGSRGSAPVAPATDRVIVELSTGSDGDLGKNPQRVSSVLKILANALLKAIEEQERGEEHPEPAAPSKPPRPAAVEAAQPPRPAWVEREPRLVDGVYQMAVVVGPYLTLEECQAKLADEFRKAVAEYVEDQLGSQAAARVRLPPDYVEAHLVRARWEERKQYSVGPMLRVHALLGFDRQAAERLHEEWTRLVVEDRLWGLGIWGAFLLVVLAAVYSYLKLDLATDGRHRRRLGAAAAAAIVLTLVVGVVLT